MRWGTFGDGYARAAEPRVVNRRRGLAAARRWFMTGDDLDTKPWLGSDRDSVFDGLPAAHGTAMDLRSNGLAFVIAPVPAISGAPAEPPTAT
jgi:hypothetical protein